MMHKHMTRMAALQHHCSSFRFGTVPKHINEIGSYLNNLIKMKEKLSPQHKKEILKVTRDQIILLDTMNFSFLIVNLKQFQALDIEISKQLIDYLN